MEVAVFSTKPYDERFLNAANEENEHEFTFFEPRLTKRTASLAAGFPAACIFVNDTADRDVLQKLVDGGTKLLVLRSAGYNHVDIDAAEDLGLTVVRVPAYSPEAVAEHTVALILALNRKIHKAYNRVREGNFALDGLLGFDLYERTIGVIGTGRIGYLTGEILHRGFGCKLLGFDPYPNSDFRKIGDYVDLPELLNRADIVSLHCPLTPDTYHIIDEEAFGHMKKGAMLVNTSRGALVNAVDAIEALKDEKLGSLALDVYEEEGDLFFEDLSDRVIKDDVFARLLTFPNVLITGHQAFFTAEALDAIAQTTVQNITAFEQGEPKNALTASAVRG